jgi:excisionase family DNA binding protein
MGLVRWPLKRWSHKRATKMPEQLLTLEEVAEYLNVDRFTVYRLLAQKQLPAFKVGSQWRFKRQMIEAWLLKNANDARKFSH